MATQISSLPPSIAALPFLFARPQLDDPQWNFRAALVAAIAAEQADDEKRNMRGRVAWLLCELGFQLARRKIDPTLPFDLSRRDLAEGLGVNLARVKRTLALMSLSNVLHCDGDRMKVMDWPRLCALGACQPRRLDLDEEEACVDLPSILEEPDDRPVLTQSGDPACFV